MRKLLQLVLLLGLGAGSLGAQTLVDISSQVTARPAPAHAGMVPLWNPPTSTFVPGDPFVSSNTPAVVQKTSATSTGSVASLAKAYTSNVVASNSLLVACGVGNGTAPTVTDTLSNTFKQAAQVANGTAFNVAVFYTVGTSAGADTVTCNNGGTTASIALEIYEVSGLIQPGTSYASQLLDATSTNTSGAATSSPSVSVSPLEPNEFSLVIFGLGTAAQTITVTAPYNNDSGQLNPTTPAGLFSLVSATSLISTVATSSPAATVGTGEPWAVAVASFKMSVLPVGGHVDQGQPQSLANAWPVKVTDGTNIQPTGDAAGREIFVNEQKIAGTTRSVNTGTADAGTGRDAIATNNPAIANWGHGATGSAVPAGATYLGGNGSGNLTGLMLCDNSSPINVSTATTTQIVAISGTGGRTYICAYDLLVAGADNVTIISGSGTNCASNVAALIGGTTAASGYNFAANGGVARGSGVGMLLKTTTTNNEVCVVTSAGVQLSGSITWTQAP